MLPNSLSKEQSIQEEEYTFPYHHIAELRRLYCAHTFTFRWGIPYVGGMLLVETLLKDFAPKRIIDVGCGDGSFPKFLSSRNPEIDVVGIDYSERAINFARGFSPNLEFRCVDILQDPIEDKFDVVTLIEVLEHIPPADASRFLDAVRDMLDKDGALILTVPHKNEPVSPKHFRHFDGESLREALGSRFSSIRIMPFDRNSIVMKILDLFLNRDDIIVNLKSTQWLRWQYYKKFCLYDVPEADCCRIAAICKI